jgi:hypothetical protein
VKKNPLSTFVINPLIHIRQKEKIAVKVASVNGPLQSIHSFVQLFQLKRDDFFEEGPTQFSDLKFTEMNLSRPILKVGEMKSVARLQVFR